MKRQGEGASLISGIYFTSDKLFGVLCSQKSVSDYLVQFKWFFRERTSLRLEILLNYSFWKWNCNLGVLFHEYLAVFFPKKINCFGVRGILHAEDRVLYGVSFILHHLTQWVSL